MKMYIYKAFRKLGYKISNEAKRKKELQNKVKKLGIIKDYNNLVFRSFDFFNQIREHYPNIILKEHKNGILAEFGDLKFFVESPEEFYILKEVFVEKDYNLLSKENYVVFDIGMNIGISSLFFALKDNITKIYSFEPVLATYKQALYNFDLNKKYSNKIEPFNLGLGGFTRTEKVLYDPQMKGNCGIRLDSSPNISLQKTEEIEISIISVEEVIKNILDKHVNQNIVLKIDCEGAEYEIIKKLESENLLVRIDVLMIEWHDKGAEILEEILIKSNFSIVSRVLSPITGMIYAFKKQ
jgi:FkbM family methyltransferase